MAKFHVGIRKLTQIDDTHRHHLCLAVDNLQQTITHQIRSRVDS